MKKFFHLVLVAVFFLVTSCQTQVVSQKKPMKENSLELYKKYTIQTNDGKTTRIQVLRTDETNIIGKTKTGEDVTITKSDVREVKKYNLLASIGIAAGAILALILIPMA